MFTSTMDALDQEIAAKLAERERLIREATAEIDIEIRVLQHAAALRPVTRPTTPPLNGDAQPEEPRRGGKPPGAISPGWRSILQSVYGRNDLKFHDFLAAAQTLGVSTNAVAVRDRVRALVVMGHLSGDQKDGFAVTEQAAERFGFKTATAQSESSGPRDNARRAFRSALL